MEMEEEKNYSRRQTKVFSGMARGTTDVVVVSPWKMQFTGRKGIFSSKQKFYIRFNC